MTHRYEDYIFGQEEPELMPNEVAYRLSQLLGHNHFLIHRALVAVNPCLIATDSDWYLSEEALPAVSAKISEFLLAETMSLLPTKNTSLACLTSATVPAR